MAVPLSLANLETISARAGVPGYARSDLSRGILHFGVGNFHRAHQAVYLDRLFEKGLGQDWALVGAGVMQGDKRARDVLAAQDWLTTVVEQEADYSRAHVTGSMIDYIEPGNGEAILEGRPVPLSGRIAYGLGRIFVYGPLKNVLGLSKVRTAYTAGEAIGEDLFSFFRSLGINLKQLYGQTEAFLYVTCQEDGAVRADAVGPAAPNVDVRISNDGEVQFKSPGMFKGYYLDDAKTAETLTEDGYVKTGDAGFFDSDGQLRIIDRAKDVGRLISGALFSPKYVENALKFFPNIKEAVAFGDQRDFCAVFINIDLTAVGNWAERNNISYASYQELAGHPRVYEMIASHVDDTNLKLSKEPMMAGAQIKRFLVLHKELDADDGELTRTQKVRRGFIGDRYGELIEALYDGSEEKFVETEVTYEDGRKGTIRATVRIADARVYDVPAEPMREAAE